MSKDAAGAEAATSAADADKIFEERGPKTIIRLVTVGAYMFSVSFAAIALSVYYIFLWHPPNSRLIHAHAAHLRADSEVEFLVADSLTAIQANKPNGFEPNNAIKEIEANDRYKYISSPTQNVIQNNKFNNFENDENIEVIAQSNAELIKEEAYGKMTRLQRGRNNIVKKADSSMINFEKGNHSSASLIHEQTSNEISTSMNKKNEFQATNFSRNNIIYNDTETSLKPENSTSKRKLSGKDFKSKKKVFDSPNSENTKVLKKFFKIL